MTKLQALALMSGLFFGIWPLIMNRSGLSGYTSAAVFSLSCFALVTPFALFNGVNQPANASWQIGIIAGLTAGVGLLLFNNMLAGAQKETVGMLFVMNLLVQVSVPVIYTTIQKGSYSPKRALGVAAAFVAVWLLR